MFKKLEKTIVVIVFVFLLFGSSSIQSAAFTDNQTVNANKNWTIQFNQEISFDSSTKAGIKVIDSKGNSIVTNLSLIQDGKTIIVNAPEDGYIAGENYQLIIDSNVKSKNQKYLNKKIIFNFNIKDNVTDNSPVTFKDSDLEKIIRNAINKPTGDILKSDVEKITNLNASASNIKTIQGLENLINLEYLDLGQNQISDISSLKNLTKLLDLDLEENQISDISALKNLTNLEYIGLWQNQISDISALKNLTNLLDLDLGRNQISDISVLENLTQLEYISLWYNQIGDISALKNLTHSKQIILDCNQVTDISALKNLTNLEWLALRDNQISDVTPLKNLTNLNFLRLCNNQISDVTPLKNLTNLEDIVLDGNQINDSDMESLKNALPECNFN